MAKEKYDPTNPDASSSTRPVDLFGPGFPPNPTEPAKPHTEEEVNKVDQTLGDAVNGLEVGDEDDDKDK